MVGWNIVTRHHHYASDFVGSGGRGIDWCWCGCRLDVCIGTFQENYKVIQQDD